MAEARPCSPGWRRHVPLLFAIFLDMMGFGMVIPDLQTRLEAFGAQGWAIGLVLSSYFLTQIVVSPLWGRLSDKVGRKPVLVICGTLSATSMVLAGCVLLVAALLPLRGYATA